MNVKVYPGSAGGVISAPPCKEEALQAMILASITKTGVRKPGNSGEAEELLNALYKMGARYRKQNDTILFYESPKQGSAEIECREDIALLLIPLCAAVGGRYTFIGKFGLDVEGMLGWAEIKFERFDQSIIIYGTADKEAIQVYDERLLPGLLLSLPILEDVVMYEGSRKHAQLTIYILEKFGFRIDETFGYSIKGSVEDPEFIYSVGGDYSSAAYMLLPGLLAGEVGVTGLLSDSMQPEKSIIEELKSYKLSVNEMNGAVFAKKSRLKEDVIDISKSEVPAAVLALCCFGKGKCVIKNAGLLQYNKEEEFRLAAEELRNLGADIVSIGDDLLVGGTSKIFGGTVDAGGSMNLSFLFASAALCSETGVDIQNCADISELRLLGISL